MLRTGRRHLEFAKSAQKDVKALKKAGVWGRVKAALERDLEPVELPKNRDVKVLVGYSPWYRLRVGSYRIIYRELTSEEITAITKRVDAEPKTGYVVKRIVHRKELHEAAEKLGLIAQEQTTLRLRRRDVG